MFTVHVNDLVTEFKNDKVGIPININVLTSSLLYSDDLVILAENADDLQKLLNVVQQLCKKWKMQLNDDKLKMCALGKGTWCKLTIYDFHCGDTEIEVVDKYTYLG